MSATLRSGEDGAESGGLEAAAIWQRHVVRTDIEELAVVELTHELEEFKSGTIGTVVSARPERDLYTVEVVDAKGRTVGLISAASAGLRVRHRPGRGLAD